MPNSEDKLVELIRQSRIIEVKLVLAAAILTILIESGILFWLNK